MAAWGVVRIHWCSKRSVASETCRQIQLGDCHARGKIPLLRQFSKQDLGCLSSRMICCSCCAHLDSVCCDQRSRSLAVRSYSCFDLEGV